MKIPKHIQEWDESAEFYHGCVGEVGDDNHRYIINPAVFRLLGGVRDKTILDAGCGQGYISRILARRGACVIGVDASRKLLSIARKIEEEQRLGIKYQLLDLSDLSSLKGERFNVILCNMVLMDLPNLEKVVGEFAKLLDSGGELILSITHPCSLDLPSSGWRKDKRGRRIYFHVDRYFDTSPHKKKFNGYVLTHYHRTLSEYVNSLASSGFRIEQMVEPQPTQEGLKKNSSLKSSLRIPYFLAIKTVRS